jgi:putative flippase GtrA
MADRGNRRSPDGQHPVRHALGFLVSGGTAFAVDALVLQLLTALLGVNPIAARIVAISLSMIAGWLMHRTFTFAVTTSPSVPEFVRYAGVAWMAAAVNFGLFVAILLARPATKPFAALVVSSAAAMTFAYLGMRFAAFRQRGGEE